VPLEAGRRSRSVRRLDESADKDRTAEWQEVSTGFFDVVGIPIVAGRASSEGLGPNEVVVNEALARSLWSDGIAVGRTFISTGSGSYVVAAVARDARLASVDQVLPTVFRVGATNIPSDQPAAAVAILARGDNAVASIRSAAASVDPRLRITVRPVDDYVSDQLRPSQVGAAIAGGLGLLAAMVSAIGVFGVFSYLVSSRAREIGIRLALGASVGHIVAAILRTALLALSSGLAVGLLAALVLMPALRSYLYGMSPLDPAAFASAAGVLILAALAATIGPLRRAMRVDPATTLRAD